MKIEPKPIEHGINLEARTSAPEGDCERCSEPWCKFNITPDETISDYMNGNRAAIKNISCNSYELDPSCIKA